MKKLLVALFAAGLGLWAGAAPLVVGLADMCLETNAVSVQTTYAAAVAAAGNTPLVLPAETDRAVVARMLASVDALRGGDDHMYCPLHVFGFPCQASIAQGAPGFKRPYPSI